MSWKVTSYVANDLPRNSVTMPERLILFCLSEVAHDDGKGIFLSVGTICRKTWMSESAVHRWLKKMIDKGVLLLGDQELVSHLPANRRPTVYEIPVPWGADLTPQTDSGVSLGGSRGVTSDAQGSRSRGTQTKEPEEPFAPAPAASGGLRDAKHPCSRCGVSVWHDDEGDPIPHQNPATRRGCYGPVARGASRGLTGDQPQVGPGVQDALLEGSDSLTGARG